MAFDEPGWPVEIRPERAGDEGEIRDVNVAAFGGSVEAGIVDRLRGTDRWLDGGSLVAVARSRVVGHLLISAGDLIPATGGGARRLWLVGPVAVAPDHQRRGIGSALMLRAIAFATERRQPVLCLLGHADFYPRFGFERATALGLEPPEPWPDENWLALRLAGWNASWRGWVRYPPAFSDAIDR
jgi:putative acetyltransferase